MTTTSDAAMRAANKILDQWEGGPIPTSDALRDIIDAEFAPLVDALQKIIDWTEHSNGNLNRNICEVARKALATKGTP